jgi:hypothetical protein
MQTILLLLLCALCLVVLALLIRRYRQPIDRNPEEEP